MMVSLRMFQVENTNKTQFFFSDVRWNRYTLPKWIMIFYLSCKIRLHKCQVVIDFPLAFLIKTCQPTCGKIHRRAWLKSNTPAVLKDPNSWLQCQRRECPRCLVGESPAQGDSKGNSYRGLNQYLYASDWWWLGFYQTYTQHLLSERTSSKKETR